MVGAGAVFLVFEEDVLVGRDGGGSVVMTVFVGIWVFRRRMLFYHFNGSIGFETGYEIRTCLV